MLYTALRPGCYVAWIQFYSSQTHLKYMKSLFISILAATAVCHAATLTIKDIAPDTVTAGHATYKVHALAGSLTATNVGGMAGSVSTGFYFGNKSNQTSCSTEVSWVDGVSNAFRFYGRGAWGEYAAVVVTVADLRTLSGAAATDTLTGIKVDFSVVSNKTNVPVTYGLFLCSGSTTTSLLADGDSHNAPNAAASASVDVSAPASLEGMTLSDTDKIVMVWQKGTDGYTEYTISNATLTTTYTSPVDPQAPTTVPEPATAALSLLALAGLAARRRRK